MKRNEMIDTNDLDSMVDNHEKLPSARKPCIRHPRNPAENLTRATVAERERDEARAMRAKAEWLCGHECIRPDGWTYCRNPRHTWTDAQWLAAHGTSGAR